MKNLIQIENHLGKNFLFSKNKFQISAILEMINGHRKRACHTKKGYLGNLIRKLPHLVQCEKLYAINVNRRSVRMMSSPNMNYCAKQLLLRLNQFTHLHVISVRNLLENSWSKLRTNIFRIYKRSHVVLKHIINKYTVNYE